MDTTQFFNPMSHSVHPDVAGGTPAEGDFGARRRATIRPRWSPGKSADHSPCPRERAGVRVNARHLLFSKITNNLGMQGTYPGRPLET